MNQFLIVDDKKRIYNLAAYKRISIVSNNEVYTIQLVSFDNIIDGISFESKEQCYSIMEKITEHLYEHPSTIVISTIAEST